jgi:formate hydrogenlyase subunit 6/NADH:ubiquinone oxidoreductase subunit I
MRRLPICTLACPKEAIKTTKQQKLPGQKAQKPNVDIDLAKCNFCGICDITCPYGAMKVTLNGKPANTVVEKECFPQLIRDIKIDTKHCPKDCVACQEACPLEQLKITHTAFLGTPDNRDVAEDNAALRGGGRNITFEDCLMKNFNNAIENPDSASFRQKLLAPERANSTFLIFCSARMAAGPPIEPR